MKEKFKTFEFVVGDWSHDGHEKTESFLVRSNKPIESIKEAYKKGSEKIGYNFTNFFQDYEQCSIPAEAVAKFVEVGVLDKSYLERDEKDISFFGDAYAYFKIWLKIAKLGDPDLKLRKIDQDGSIPIGGYGLY